MERRHFLTRHSIKPKGEDTEDTVYRGISRAGVAKARESSKDLLNYFEKSPSDAIIFLGGASDEVRTKSTAEVYGAELKNLLRGRDDYVVITKEDVKGRGENNAISQIKRIIEDNPHKRIIIDLPLFIKEFSLKQKGWFTREGKPSAYLTRLLEKGGGNEEKAMEYWFDHGGDIDGLEGPTPIQVAKAYEKGINKLEKFAKAQFGNRPYLTGLVGHSLEADTYLTYLAGEGKIDSSIYEALTSGKGMIKETELASIKVDPKLTTISYRGKETERKTLENITAVFAVGSLLISFLSFSGITGNVIGPGNSNTFGLVSLVLAAIFGVAFYFNKRKKITRQLFLTRH